MAKTATNEAHEIKATNLTDEERAFLEEHADQLSNSTLRAKWIHSPDEEADRPGQTLATRSRAVIEAWAEARGGTPVTVPETERDGRPGVLRMSFREGGGTGRLQEVDWDDRFRSFEERDLVFVFQDRKRDGSQSTFFRPDSPEREDG
jgi:hypothetical protein